MEATLKEDPSWKNSGDPLTTVREFFERVVKTRPNCRFDVIMNQYKTASGSKFDPGDEIDFELDGTVVVTARLVARHEGPHQDSGLPAKTARHFFLSDIELRS